MKRESNNELFSFILKQKQHFKTCQLFISLIHLNKVEISKLLKQISKNERYELYKN